MLPVTLDEPLQQLRDERLREHRPLVEPGRGAELRVAEHGRVQLRERVDRQARLLHRAAGDLVALAAGSRSSSTIVKEPSGAIAAKWQSASGPPIRGASSR